MTVAWVVRSCIMWLPSSALAADHTIHARPRDPCLRVGLDHAENSYYFPPTSFLDCYLGAHSFFDYLVRSLKAQIGLSAQRSSRADLEQDLLIRISPGGSDQNSGFSVTRKKSKVCLKSPFSLNFRGADFGCANFSSAMKISSRLRWISHIFSETEIRLQSSAATWSIGMIFM